MDQAAQEVEQWLDQLDPATMPAEDTSDLRAIGLAVLERNRNEQRITEAVRRARDNGQSWGQIAMVLGVTRQSARERYDRRED